MKITLENLESDERAILGQLQQIQGALQYIAQLKAHLKKEEPPKDVPGPGRKGRQAAAKAQPTEPEDLTGPEEPPNRLADTNHQ